MKNPPVGGSRVPGQPRDVGRDEWLESLPPWLKRGFLEQSEDTVGREPVPLGSPERMDSPPPRMPKGRLQNTPPSSQPPPAAAPKNKDALEYESEFPRDESPSPEPAVGTRDSLEYTPWEDLPRPAVGTRDSGVYEEAYMPLADQASPPPPAARSEGVAATGVTLANFEAEITGYVHADERSKCADLIVKNSTNAQVLVRALDSLWTDVEQGWPTAVAVLRELDVNLLSTPANGDGPEADAAVRHLVRAASVGNEIALGLLAFFVKSPNLQLANRVVSQLMAAKDEGNSELLGLLENMDITEAKNELAHNNPEAVDVLYGAAVGGNREAFAVLVDIVVKGEPSAALVEDAFLRLGVMAIEGNHQAAEALMKIAERGKEAEAKKAFDFLTQAMVSQGYNQRAREMLRSFDLAKMPRDDRRFAGMCAAAAAGNPTALLGLGVTLASSSLDDDKYAKVLESLVAAGGDGNADALERLAELGVPSDARGLLAREAMGEARAAYGRRPLNEVVLPKNFQQLLCRKYAQSLVSEGGGHANWGFKVVLPTGELVFCRLPKLEVTKDPDGHPTLTSLVPAAERTFAYEMIETNQLGKSGHFPGMLDSPRSLDVSLRGGLTKSVPCLLMEPMDTDAMQHLAKAKDACRYGGKTVSEAVDDIAKIAQDTIAAAQYLVRVGAVHHDIKADNVLLQLDEKGRVKRAVLTDFEGGASFVGNRAPSLVVPEGGGPASSEERATAECLAEFQRLKVADLPLESGGFAINMKPPEVQSQLESVRQVPKGPQRAEAARKVFNTPAYDAYGVGLMINRALYGLPEPADQPTRARIDKLKAIASGLQDVDPQRRLDYLLSLGGGV